MRGHELPDAAGRSYSPGLLEPGGRELLSAVGGSPFAVRTACVRRRSTRGARSRNRRAFPSAWSERETLEDFRVLVAEPILSAPLLGHVQQSGGSAWGLTGGYGLAGDIIGAGGRDTGQGLNLRWWYTRDDRPVIFRHALRLIRQPVRRTTAPRPRPPRPCCAGD